MIIIQYSVKCFSSYYETFLHEKRSFEVKAPSSHSPMSESVNNPSVKLIQGLCSFMKRLFQGLFKAKLTRLSHIKAILCNSPNYRSAVVLKVFENPDNFVIGCIADDVVLPGKLVPFTFLNKIL